MRPTLTFFLLCINCTLFAQSFILNQFFQPSLSVSGEYTIDRSLTQDRWEMARMSANLIVPVKSKLGLEIDWTKLFSIKSLTDVKNMAKVKAHQIFWTLRPQVTALQYRALAPKITPFSDSISLSYGVQTGVTGLHLLSKMRILFYSINVGAQEEIRSMNKLRPYGTAIVGVVNFNRLMYYWYYGVAISASNGQRWPVMPIPFFGVDLNLSKKLWWNITLPLQTRFEWKPSRFVKIDAIAGFGTYGWGFAVGNQIGGYDRHYVSGVQFKTGGALNLKTKRGTKFYFEAGYMPFRSFGFDIGRSVRPFANPTALQASPYFAFSIYYGFKKSLLGTTVENFLNF